MESTKLLPAPMLSIAAASIQGTYTFVGKLTQSARILWIQNLTSGEVVLSFDGVTDWGYLLSNAFVLLDLGTNKGTYNTSALPANFPIYVKQGTTAPGSGSLYVSSMYAG